MTGIKEKIETLNAQGLSYTAIAEQIPCSLSTVKYYLVPGRKEKELARTQTYKAKNPLMKRITAFNESHCRIPVKGFENKITHFNRKEKTSISKQQILEKFKEQNEKCYLTGEPINLADPNSYSFDHKIPVSQGGGNDITNLGICTAKSNCHKYDKTLPEFLEFCKQVLEFHGSKVITPTLGNAPSSNTV